MDSLAVGSIEGDFRSAISSADCGIIASMKSIGGSNLTSSPLDLGQGDSFARRFPLLTRAALILVWPLSLMAVFVSVRQIVMDGAIGQDSHAYWLAAQGGLIYGAVPGQRDAYLYSPVFVTVIKPLAMLPWPLFATAWVAIEAAALVWLVAPLRLRWAIPLFLLGLPELVVSNIYVLLAVSAVVGLQKPAAWSFAILTKVTAGVGLLWYAARGDWKRLFQGIGATAVIVAVSYALDPSVWHAWVRFLLDNRSGTPDSSISFVARGLLAVGLVVFAARTGWAFLIAPAVVLASPVLTPVIPFTILLAVPRLLQLGPSVVTPAQPQIS